MAETAISWGKVVTAMTANGKVNLAIGRDGRVKYAYHDLPPTADLVEALRDYDNGLTALDLPSIAKGIAQLVP